RHIPAAVDRGLCVRSSAQPSAAGASTISLDWEFTEHVSLGRVLQKGEFLARPHSAENSRYPVRRTNVYTNGTENKGANVASIRPPIPARPSGAFCSAPSPIPSDIGIMPTIIASAVIITGRSRVIPALRAAATALLPAFISPAAKFTSRMLFEVAT